MWSQKSTQLLTTAMKHRKGAGWAVGMFTPVKDTRSGVGWAKSHDGLAVESVNCAHPNEILDNLPANCKMVCIEELHMWIDPDEVPPGEITRVWDSVLDALENKNIRVYLSGLDKSYKGEHFESYLAVSMRSIVRMSHSWCSVDNCGAKALYSGWVGDQPPNATIIAGGEGKFMAMCRFHFYNNLNK
jgi:thymidine kinase